MSLKKWLKNANLHAKWASQLFYLGMKVDNRRGERTNGITVGERWELSDLNEALRVLKDGGLILYPTDTVWGIGCDATNPEAVRRVFALKQRDDAKALISITHTNAILRNLMSEVPEIAYDLIDATTNPLTIIYPKVHGLAENLLAEDGSAAIRIVDEPFCVKMCERFRKPIVSTSANISGQPTPKHFGKIADEIRSGVDYVVKYRQRDRTEALPSSIIKLEANGTFVVIR